MAAKLPEEGGHAFHGRGRDVAVRAEVPQRFLGQVGVLLLDRLEHGNQRVSAAPGTFQYAVYLGYVYLDIHTLSSLHLKGLAYRKHARSRTAVSQALLMEYAARMREAR